MFPIRSINIYFLAGAPFTLLNPNRQVLVGTCLQHLPPLTALSGTFFTLGFHSSGPKPCFFLLCCLPLTSPPSSFQGLSPVPSSMLGDAAPAGLPVRVLSPTSILTWVQLLLGVVLLDLTRLVRSCALPTCISDSTCAGQKSFSAHTLTPLDASLSLGICLSLIQLVHKACPSCVLSVSL